MIWYICMWVEKTATQTTQVFNKLFVRKKRERRRFLEDIDVYLHPHTYTPFLYPFICQQALRLSQHLGYRREYWLQWIWECRYFFETIILWPLDLYSETGLLDHTVVLLLIFWGTSILFSIVAALIYIPTDSIEGFPILHILVKHCYLLSFWQQTS